MSYDCLFLCIVYSFFVFIPIPIPIALLIALVVSWPWPGKTFAKPSSQQFKPLKRPRSKVKIFFVAYKVDISWCCFFLANKKGRNTETLDPYLYHDWSRRPTVDTAAGLSSDPKRSKNEPDQKWSDDKNLGLLSRWNIKMDKWICLPLLKQRSAVNPNEDLMDRLSPRLRVPQKSEGDAGKNNSERPFGVLAGDRRWSKRSNKNESHNINIINA